MPALPATFPSSSPLHLSLSSSVPTLTVSLPSSSSSPCPLASSSSSSFPSIPGYAASSSSSCPCSLPSSPLSLLSPFLASHSPFHSYSPLRVAMLDALSTVRDIMSSSPSSSSNKVPASALNVSQHFLAAFAHKKRSEYLISHSAPVDRQRLLVLSSPHSLDFLHAIPSEPQLRIASRCMPVILSTILGAPLLATLIPSPVFVALLLKPTIFCDISLFVLTELRCDLMTHRWICSRHSAAQQDSTLHQHQRCFISTRIRTRPRMHESGTQSLTLSN